MTKNEFYNLKLEDYVYDKELNDTGEIVVGSRGEWYVAYPSRPNMLVTYDPVEEPECWTKIEKINN